MGESPKTLVETSGTFGRSPKSGGGTSGTAGEYPGKLGKTSESGGSISDWGGVGCNPAYIRARCVQRARSNSGGDGEKHFSVTPVALALRP